MSRKKKVLTEEPKKVFSKEEVEAALELTHSEYFMNIIALLSHDSTQEQLNYAKCAVTTPDGGVYLVSLLHIEGPKVNLKRLAESAEAYEKEKK